MFNQNFCQSCSMPLNSQEMMGTEPDGSKNSEYCVYCYQNGAFTTPGMSLEEMKALVSEKMKERHIEQSIIDMSLHMLPNLKRWTITPPQPK